MLSDRVQTISFDLSTAFVAVGSYVFLEAELAVELLSLLYETCADG